MNQLLVATYLAQNEFGLLQTYKCLQRLEYISYSILKSSINYLGLFRNVSTRYILSHIIDQKSNAELKAIKNAVIIQILRV